MKNKKLKVAIYCRVAIKDDEKIREQKENLKNFCKLNNYDIYNIYADNGYSGKNVDRPAYKQMFDDIKKGKIDMIITYSLDKLTRSIVELENIMTIIKKYNCTLKLLKEKIDSSTPSGMLFTRFLNLIFEYERRCVENE